MSDIIEYIPNFISNPDEIFDRLWNELNWEKRGQARIEYWTNEFDRPYTYGKDLGLRTYESQPTHECIEVVKAALEDKYGFHYEACFLNGYEGIKNALGWHSDDDPKIDHDYGIAVVSVGGVRDISFMEKGNPASRQSIALGNGSLFMMNAGMQATHLHCIPKGNMPKRGEVTKPRISLTFRKLFP